METFGEYGEKVENLTVELEAMRCAANSFKMHYERLIEENERLENALIEQSAENVMLIGENKRLRACTNLVPTLNEVKADTVSNLKSRMAIQFGTYTGKDTIPIKELFDVLDKVCEEILDEDHD
jgi:CRISPR/Cas system CSM-associated protein Csm2 small subunit